VRAVQLNEFTESPGSVTVSEIPQPSPAPGEVLVRIEAAAINPSDLVNIRGGFPMTKLPRVIGRDFAGRVVQGPPHLRDREVWGAGGSDLGLTRDGTHAEYIALPQDAVALRPEKLAPEDAAGSGIPYITAWLALVERAGITRGDFVLVSGAAGSVGRAALEIVHYAGARSIALVKDANERATLDMRRVAAVAQSDTGDVEQVVREATGGKGCDIALNVVGAPIFGPLMASLAEKGRMAIVSGVAGRIVEQLNLFDLYRRDLSLLGINTASPQFSAVDSARILTEMHAAFETGQVAPIRSSARYPLEQAPQAYERVARTAGEKVVLVP
jgi:NADPH:quinone reductase-like Zn-dependent oxidoreductase